MVLIFDYDCYLIDVVTAFLHGELLEEIYMECPAGMEHTTNEVLLLEKSIYGLVQSARQFFKKLVTVLKEIGFVQNIADPCLLWRKTETGYIAMVIHVDDCFTIGNKIEIEKMIEELKMKNFELKVEKNVTDYLGCELRFNKERSKIWLGQPTIIKKIQKTFEDIIKVTDRYKTPGTPNFNVLRPQSENDYITTEQQKIYQSGVGSLLYLTTHSRPDISNAVRELSKNMDHATEAAMKELIRVINFVISTKEYGLKIEPIPNNEKQWNIVVYSDSDWAGDKDTRHSVSGYIIYMLGVPILWKSRAQKTVALSSAEAEYIAMSESAKEIKFVLNVLTDLGYKVNLPVIVHVDIVGAIFMSENPSATGRTRHIDTRYHFVREMVEDGTIKIIFVRSELNQADGFTKNLSTDLYERHKANYIAEKNSLMNTCITILIYRILLYRNIR